MDRYSLVELIIKTGIHDTIARKLNEKSKLSMNAIAEGIIHNVRKTIIRDQLTDPRFYKEMSKLMDDLIKQRWDDTKSYEEFLRKAKILVQKLAKGQFLLDIPHELHGKPEATVIYNNLPDIMGHLTPASALQEPVANYGTARLELALKIGRAMRESAPAGWKGDDIREKQVLNALFPLLRQNRKATMAMFELIKNRSGYA